jgi:hypothetical protein
MPRRKKGWSKVSAWTVIVLGLVASITINLVTAWLQKDVISNALYLFLVFFLLAAIMYSARKMRTPPLLNNVFWFLVASVSFNLFSTWIQMSLLHDTYTVSSVTLFLSLTIIALSLSALIESHYFRRRTQGIRMKRIWNARSMTPVVLQQKERKSTVKKRLPRQKRKKI